MNIKMLNPLVLYKGKKTTNERGKNERELNTHFEVSQ